MHKNSTFNFFVNIKLIAERTTTYAMLPQVSPTRCFLRHRKHSKSSGTQLSDDYSQPTLGSLNERISKGKFVIAYNKLT